MENKKRFCNSSSPTENGKKAKLDDNHLELSPIHKEQEVTFHSPIPMCSTDVVAPSDSEMFDSEVVEGGLIHESEEVDEVESLNESFQNLTASEMSEEEDDMMPTWISSYEDFCKEWENDFNFRKFRKLMHAGVEYYNKNVFPKMKVTPGGYHFCDFCDDDLLKEIELMKKLKEDIGCGCEMKISLRTLAAELRLRDICWNMYKVQMRKLLGGEESEED